MDISTPTAATTTSATPKRFDPTHAVVFDKLKSHCPKADARAAKREDPFDGLTVNRDQPVAWYERTECGSDPDGIDTHSIYTYLPESLVEDPANALETLLAFTVTRRRCVALLGLCFADGVTTIEHAACVLGVDLNIARRLVRHAFAASLIDIGLEPGSASHMTRFNRGTTMIRLNNSDHHKTYLSRLSHVERCSILGAGQWPDSTSRSERHDVHALEFALRVAEFTDVSAIVGERFATKRLLIGLPAKGTNSLHYGGPDFCFVRGDGARILVEHTASDASVLTRKVRRLTELLSADADLIVLFVVATDPHNNPDAEARAVRRIGRAIDEAAISNPQHWSSRTWKRMAVIRWRDYFPAPGQVHPDFTDLLAYRRTTPPHNPTWQHGPRGPRSGPAWEGVALLSARDLPVPLLNPPPIQRWLDTIAGLGQTPHWMRGTTSADALPDHLGRHLDPKIAAALQLPAGTTARWRSVAPRDRGHALTVNQTTAAPDPVARYTTAALSPWNPYDPFELPPCTLHDRGLSLRDLAGAHRLALTADYYFDPGDRLYGLTTLLSILACAKNRVDGKFLRDMPIHDLLAAQYQWSNARAHSTLKTTAAILEAPIKTNATLGWLLDPRSDGRRPIALLAAVSQLSVVPTDVPWEPPQLA